MSFWVLEFLLMKNSCDKKTPTPSKKTLQTQKTKQKKDGLHRIYMFPTRANEYESTLNVLYLNTIISLYFKCLVFKHHY